MNLKFFVLPLLLLSSSCILAQDVTGYKNFTGSYNIYGGELGDTTEPKVGDKKIAIELDGKASKEIFDSIGPDLHGPQVCVADPKDRYRKKGSIQCIHSHNGSYSCTFGFDMITGKSILGSIC